MIRFVSFRSPTRGSPTRSSDPARRRDPSSITATVAPPSDRASARRRVAPARDRRDATREKPKNRKTEKSKNRKIEKPKNRNRKRPSTATISRASGVRQNPAYCLPTRHKNRSVGHPRASPGVVARRRKPARGDAMSSDEEGAPAPAMAHGEEARRRRRAFTIDALNGSARTARAGERRARDEG